MPYKIYVDGDRKHGVLNSREDWEKTVAKVNETAPPYKDIDVEDPDGYIIYSQIGPK